MADADSIAAPAAIAPQVALSSHPETASAVTSLSRALRLLRAASPDWQRKGPTDGSEPLHWPAAVATASAHIEHALRLLKPSITLTREAAATDAQLGMDWWNGLPAAERREWMRRAGNTGVAADAWAVFKAQR
jgi:hypothetical protein